MSLIAQARTVPLALGGADSYAHTPLDIVDSVIAFANRERTPDLDARADSFRLAESDDYFLQIDHNDFEVFSKDDARKIAAHQFEEERAFAIAMLDVATVGSPQLAKWIHKQVKAGRVTQVSSYPFITFEHSRIRMNWRFGGPTRSEGWTMFAAALLFDWEKGGQTCVGRCKLNGCRKFFRIVIKGPGKPRRYYCCPDHMLLAHQKDSTRRRRVATAKKKAEVGRSRRSRHK